MKIKIVYFFIIASIMVSCFISGFASAKMEKPEWKIGDYWEYEMTVDQSGYTLSATGKLELTDKKTITINEKEFETFRQEGTLNYTSDTLPGSIEVTLIAYYRISDHYLVKLISDSDSFGHSEEMTQPSSNIEWPLEIGKTFNIKYTKTTIEGSNTSTEEGEIHYECLRKSEVSTKAGSFDCYVLKKSKDGSGNYTIKYYSPKAGGYVKSEEYENNSLASSASLISYSYGDGTSNDNNGGLPGFEITLLIAVVSLFVFWRKQRKI